MNPDMGSAGDLPARPFSHADTDERWEAWRANGARADARTQKHANWLLTAILGASGLWVVFEMLRAGSQAP